MKKFYYHNIAIYFKDHYDGLTNAMHELNSMGVGGWELVQYHIEPSPDQKDFPGHMLIGVMKKEYFEEE